MGTKVEPEPGPRRGRKQPEAAAEQESERAARRVSHGLEHGAAEDELDQADVERVAETTSSPQPPPDERQD
ncbi:hypothetical protein LO762_23120 [Actinocorallia sp. API 0066]|uniref:hypothetical protein n=1 Tax=Actinocorallia sp. API 0066 TaxID=2896846 RepID=UPI001E5393E0|nr:hypothetical protein [Actinocorallia sp. API 0066]MCD0452061.1 hypothetical protein [Actinocorallia sp. API 0066]